MGSNRGTAAGAVFGRRESGVRSYCRHFEMVFDTGLGSVDAATTVAVPAGLWSDLVRDGVPAARLTPGGQLMAGPAAPGPADLARFGPLTVTDRDGGPTRTAGAELAANPGLDASPAVQEAIRSGTLDIRAVAVLAGLAGRGPVTVLDVPALPGETQALPRHVVELEPVDPETLAWLQAQRAPFAPSITTDDEGTTLSWPVPVPTALR